MSQVDPIVTHDLLELDIFQKRAYQIELDIFQQVFGFLPTLDIKEQQDGRD